MKRSLLALAVLGAFAGVASAQSSVTIYGVLDVAVSKTNNGTSQSAAAVVNGNNPARGFSTQNVWAVGQAHANMLGFTGREDLGSSMYARFDIQARFLPDTGTLATPNVFWAGRTVVALGSTQWGEIYAGREYTPVSWIGIAADPTGWNYVSRLDTTYTLAGYGSGSANDNSYIRHNNGIGYKTPKFNGLQGEAQIAAGEGVTPRRAIGLSAVYAAGPIYAGIGYDGMDSNNRVIALTGSYDFGIAKVYANGAQARGGFNGGSFGGAYTPNYRAKSFSAGVAAPLGNGKIFAQGGRYDPTGSGAGVTGLLSKSTKFGLGYEYNLSKRTFLYTTAATAKKDNVGATTFSRANGFDVGVYHKF